jgi:hypothetical protein
MGSGASTESVVIEGGVECVHGRRGGNCIPCGYAMSWEATHLPEWSANVRNHSQCHKYGTQCGSCHCAFCGKPVHETLLVAGSHPECWIRWKKERKPEVSTAAADIVTQQIGWRYKRLTSLQEPAFKA